MACGLWGYFLYQGVIDPLGGIYTLWPLFGISNQMLAAIALTLARSCLFKMKRQRFAWITIVPTAWLVVCTLTAGLQKVFSADLKIGFLSHAAKFAAAAADGKVLAPAKTVGEMYRVIFNDYVDATMAAAFAFVVIATLAFGILRSLQALGNPRISALEVSKSGMLAMPAGDD